MKGTEMKKEITFRNMEHSAPLEEHANAKLAKIEEYLGGSEDFTPFSVELRLDAHKMHAHHHVELHLRTPHFALHTHEEGPDMYIAVDDTIDKMVKLIIKEKEKYKDKLHKQEKDKNKFSSDKYKL